LVKHANDFAVKCGDACNFVKLIIVLSSNIWPLLPAIRSGNFVEGKAQIVPES